MGRIFLYWAFMAMIGRCRMAECSVARWCGVAGRSCFFDDFGSGAGFGDELLLRQQVVREEAVQFPDLVELGQFRRGVVPQVANQFTDPGPILLLHVSAVILVARPGPGEGDLVFLAVPVELVVDELAAVIGIDADDGEGEHRSGVLDRFEDPLLGLVAHGPVHRPARGDVGDGER